MAEGFKSSYRSYRSQTPLLLAKALWLDKADQEAAHADEGGVCGVGPSRGRRERRAGASVRALLRL